jgi:plastocyanin
MVVMYRFLVFTAFLLVGLFGASSAFAANQTVTATPSNSFVEKDVTIAPGETVTWNNAGGTHNVHFDDNSFQMPMSPSSSTWTVPRTFGQAPGTYRYYCDLHGGPGGVGMAGSVTVSAGGVPSPSPGPGPSSPGTPADDAKPVASLTAPSTQDVDSLYVRASMDEAGTLKATGRVNVPGAAKVYRFRPVSRTASPNVVVKLRLKLSKRSLRAVKRTLRSRRLRAKITVTAQDSSGNRTERTRRVRLTN